MAIFKCKMCGGTIEFNAGDTVGVCDSCGTKQTLPKLDDEKRIQLYDRANYFRRENEFDKAMGIYEMIIADEKEDAEAYWGIVLCKYGIEYVEDPRTHKRIPTVNRAQYTSVFDDKDYQSAIKYADGYQRDVIESEAKTIDAIQKGILEISNKEEPFDVFICYKETDASGSRTQDSVYAQDIYKALTDEGYKVFFSRITLESKLGQQYEPYIFAALNSAKVMLAIGTSKENFEAVWVKNEWSRFLAFTKTDKSKVLIPCYKDISPYDMPGEFTYLQSQDMSKIGFIQDLLHGISKVVKKSTPKEMVNIKGSPSEVAPLLKRAFIFLEDNDWESANQYCERILDIEPENPDAYLGKLLASLRLSKKERLKDCKTPFDNNSNYQKAIKYANPELKAELQGYNDYVWENKKNYDLQFAYDKASKEFESLKQYPQESSIPELLELISAFEKLGDWKDSSLKASECQALIDSINEKIEQEAEKKRIQEENAKKEVIAKHNKNYRVTIILSVIAVVFAIAAPIISLKIVPTLAYKRIGTTATQEQYEDLKCFLNYSYTEDELLSVRTRVEQTYVDKNDFYGLMKFAYAYNRSGNGDFHVGEDQYEAYYKAIVNYDIDTWYTDALVKGLRFQCAMMKKLPENYKDSNAYTECLELFESFKSGDYYYIDTNRDVLIKNFNNVAVKKTIYNSNGIDEFMLGSWSGDGYYLRFYKKSEDDNSIYYDSDLPTTSGALYDHYMITGNKMIWTRDSDDKTADVFKFDFVDGNTVKVYCYENGKTYKLTR